MSWAIKIENLSKRYALGKTNVTAAELINSKIKSIISLGFIKKDINDPKASKEAEEKREVLHKDQFYGSKEFYALRNINLEITTGERVGIIGPNGCGKSTLLKILSRIVSPTEGEFRFVGRLISLLEIGTGFHGDLTGRENIYLNGTIMGMTQCEIREKIGSIIEFSELGAMIDTPVKRYSSGMYVRLAFAVAAHLESEILIVDEVLAVGDAAFQKKCTDKMLDLANQGRTLIFVSHNMEAVNTICNRVIRMEHGSIVEDSIDNTADSHHSASEVTRAYLEPVEHPVQSICWDQGKAPIYRDWIRFISIKVSDRDGKTKESYDVTEDLFVSLTFEVLEESYPLNCHLKVTDSAGHFVFIAMDNHFTDGSNKPKGIYNHTCHIHTPLLNVGDYLVEVDMWSGQPTEEKPSLNQSIGFKICDSSVPGGVRGDWPNEWPNCLTRPELKWKIERLENG